MGLASLSGRSDLRDGWHELGRVLILLGQRQELLFGDMQRRVVDQRDIVFPAQGSPAGRTARHESSPAVCCAVRRTRGEPARCGECLCGAASLCQFLGTGGGAPDHWQTGGVLHLDLVFLLTLPVQLLARREAASQPGRGEAVMGLLLFHVSAPFCCPWAQDWRASVPCALVWEWVIIGLPPLLSPRPHLAGEACRSTPVAVGRRWHPAHAAGTAPVLAGGTRGDQPGRQLGR